MDGGLEVGSLERVYSMAQRLLASGLPDRQHRIQGKGSYHLQSTMNASEWVKK